jgi:hypothetical protein
MKNYAFHRMASLQKPALAKLAISRFDSKLAVAHIALNLAIVVSAAYKWRNEYD